MENKLFCYRPDNVAGGLKSLFLEVAVDVGEWNLLMMSLESVDYNRAVYSET
jgi:hypothetical protein